MYLAYMDECGNTGTNADADQPIHFLGCLLVEDVSVRALEDQVRAIAAEYFPDIARRPRFEFHGVDLFGGKGFFKGTDVGRRIAAAEALMRAASEHAAGFGYIGVNKLKSYANDHPHRICFTLMAERLEVWLKGKDSLALLISDENHEVEQHIINDILTFKSVSTQWGYKRVPVTRVIDTVHFVKSHNSPAIQVADVATFLKLKDIRTQHALFREYIDTGVHLTSTLWPDWRETKFKPAERATYELVQAMKAPNIMGKIWPDM